MNSRIFGVIPGPDLKTAGHLLDQGKAYVDGIELRLDLFTQIDFPGLKDFLKSCELPVMFTVRRSDQGGAFSGNEAERLNLLESLCSLQPAYIDLEYDVPLEFRKKLFENFPQISFLSSYHDFSKTPENLEEVFDQIKTPYAHLYKMAFAAKSSLDALRLLVFLQSRRKDENVIAISMEENGAISRILTPIVGGLITYASLAEGVSTAPGQILAKELCEVYRFHQLNDQTQIYALIGDPVNKSLGHLVHNAVFDEAKMNAVYVRINVKPEELSSFFTSILKLAFKGLSITMPHKESVIAFLKTSSETQAIHACNTIKIEDGSLIGYNTDGIGALNAIEQKGKVFGRHIVFIGAGGAARALIFEASKRGATVTVINRTSEKAKEIAKMVNANGGGFDLLPEVCKKGYDILINCTPDTDPIEDQWILRDKIVMDLIYVPKMTPFLTKALQKDCQIVYGYEMFIGQAIEQERIWFPKGVDFEKAYAIIEEKVIRTLN